MTYRAAKATGLQICRTRRRLQIPWHLSRMFRITLKKSNKTSQRCDKELLILRRNYLSGYSRLRARKHHHVSTLQVPLQVQLPKSAQAPAKTLRLLTRRTQSCKRWKMKHKRSIRKSTSPKATQLMARRACGRRLRCTIRQDWTPYVAI